MKRIPALCLLVMLISASFARGEESEVLKDSGAKVFVREHPQTGRPFVSIRVGDVANDPFSGFKRREIRPDYKMLEADAKGIPYDGPVSDRTKVYAFAAAMMTLGVAGGIVTAALPASAAAAGVGSAGTGALVGGAVVANAVAADIVVESQIKPGEEHYVHTAESRSMVADPRKLSFQEALREADDPV